MLENGGDTNAWSGDYGNGLQAASCQDHKKIVQLLLERGAEVNAEDGDQVWTQSLRHKMRFATVVYYESLSGLTNTVEVLFKMVDYVNARRLDYGNPLQAASYWEHKEIIQLLVRKQADINAQGSVKTVLGIFTLTFS